MVQDLMDKKEIEFSDSIDPSINVITSTTYSGTPSSTSPMPITIFTIMRRLEMKYLKFQYQY